IVTYALPDFAGRMKFPVNVAPACKTIVSPGCALLMAACRSPPALTVTTPPVDDGGVDEGGEDGGGVTPDAGAEADVAVTLMLSTLRPAESNISVICCWPAPSVTGTLTVV